MTKITITYEHDIINISAVDHATGSAAVCSGISTLIYTLEAWLENNPSSYMNHTCELKSGYAFLEYRPTSQACRDVTGAVILGLLQIENTFKPEYLSVDIDEKSMGLIRCVR